MWAVASCKTGCSVRILLTCRALHTPACDEARASEKRKVSGLVMFCFPFFSSPPSLRCTTPELEANSNWLSHLTWKAYIIHTNALTPGHARTYTNAYVNYGGVWDISIVEMDEWRETAAQVLRENRSRNRIAWSEWPRYSVLIERLFRSISVCTCSVRSSLVFRIDRHLCRRPTKKEVSFVITWIWCLFFSCKSELKTNDDSQKQLKTIFFFHLFDFHFLQLSSMNILLHSWSSMPSIPTRVSMNDVWIHYVCVRVSPWSIAEVV